MLRYLPTFPDFLTGKRENATVVWNMFWMLVRLSPATTLSEKTTLA